MEPVYTPKTAKKIVIRVLLTFTAITSTLIQCGQFAVYFGNLVDRVTVYLFTDSSALLQALPSGLGWWLSYLFSAMIMMGPMDYYCTLGDGNMLNLVVSLIGIYFIAAIWIGINMRNYHPIGGFILGFLSIIFLNIVAYLACTKLSFLLSGFDTMGLSGMVEEIMDGLLGGMYGEDPAIFLFRGMLINGAIFGIFGAFWTAIFMKPKKALNNDEDIPIICDDLEEMCYVPDKFAE